MKVLLPTNDKKKIEKWGALIKNLGYELVTLDDLKEQMEEQEIVFENVLKEAEFYYKKTKIVTVIVNSSACSDNSVEESITICHGLNAYESQNYHLSIRDEGFTSEQITFLKNSLYNIDNLMEYNFNTLVERVNDAHSSISNFELNDKLLCIKDPCICVGCGGSSAVSLFASRVLESKNRIITMDMQPRDILYRNLTLFDNLFAVTYGNNNYGINRALEKAMQSGLSTYVLTNNGMQNDFDKLIVYNSKLPREHSFISMASTFMPMSVMLKYYSDFDDNYINDLVISMYENAKANTDIELENNMNVFEIMAGYNTYTAAKVLESTITESGIGIPVVHEKYDYCHGRSNLSFYNKNSVLIYLKNGLDTELDTLLLSELKKYYKNIIVLESHEDDKIIGEFDLSMKAMLLCGKIAESQNKDLSKVDYCPVVKKLYRFKDNM